MQQSLHNGALVDNRIQWIPHLVRNRRIYQGKKLTFSLRGVVQNLLRDIRETNHCLLGTHAVLYLTFLELEEGKPRNEFIFETTHTFQVADDLLQQNVPNIIDFRKITINQFLVICKDFVAEFKRTEIGNLQQRELSLHNTIL
jgi:hypothetical protein